MLTLHSFAQEWKKRLGEIQASCTKKIERQQERKKPNVQGAKCKMQKKLKWKISVKT